MNCIFGIFEIFGFPSFCENCEFQHAEQVLKSIDDFETEILDTLLYALGYNDNAPNEDRSTAKGQLKWVVFSDTFFVAMPIQTSDKVDTVKFNLIFFIFLVAHINRRMFEVGLPIRGVVHVGDIILTKRRFAGKIALDAHRLGAQCQLAGTIVSDEAYSLIFDSFKESERCHWKFSQLIVESVVPIDTRQASGDYSQKMKTLCWFFLETEGVDRFEIPSDLGMYVREKFTAHGKELPDGKEVFKAFNTARLFECWKEVSAVQSSQPVAVGPVALFQGSQTVERQELFKRIKQLLKDVYYPTPLYSENYYGTILVDDVVVHTVLNVLDTLQIREVTCLCLKYGITGTIQELEKIAQSLPHSSNPFSSVSPGRARQIIAKALRKLRHPVRMKKIFVTMGGVEPDYSRQHLKHRRSNKGV